MTVHVDTVGHAVVLTIDRPKAKNAIDGEVARLIGASVRAASADPSVRGVVLTGAGHDTFVSGGDLKELAKLAGRKEGAHDVAALVHELEACEACDVPVLAALQGDALGGGCELVLLCDMVLIERHAGFVFRHAKMGLTPAWGGVTRLTERVGALEAARVLFTAERIEAAEALRLGLVNQVVDTGTSREQAIARVNRIAENPRTSVSAIKRAIRETRKARRGDAIERERAVFAEVWGESAHRAAMDAFFARKG